MPGIKAVEDRYSYWGIRGPKRKPLGQEHAFSIDGSRAGAPCLAALVHQVSDWCTSPTVPAVVLPRSMSPS
jgi:hypothetical protein